MKLLTIALLLVNILSTHSYSCSCSQHSPIFSKTYSLSSRSSVCAGCKYTNILPYGYDYLDISYEYGQKISQAIYQNGNYMGGCESSKTCQKRINIDPRYQVEIHTTRQTATNSYATHGKHYIDLNKRRRLFTRSLSTLNITCDNPPELNMDPDDQNGFIIPNCVYNYNIFVGNDIAIDMEFNNTVYLSIYSTNNKLLYSGNGNTFFDSFNTSTDNVIISLTSPNFISIKWFVAYAINDAYDENYENINQQQNNNVNLNTFAIAISALVITLILCLGFIIFFTYNNLKYKLKKDEITEKIYNPL
jgi:hypothetical protein